MSWFFAVLLLVAIGFTLQALRRSFDPSATPQSSGKQRFFYIALLVALVWMFFAALSPRRFDDLEVFIVGALLVVLVVPVWALVRTFRLRRDSATREELARLTERVFALESRLRELQKAQPAAAPAPEAKPVPPAAAPPPVAAPPPEEKPAPPPLAQEKPLVRPATPAPAPPRAPLTDIPTLLGGRAKAEAPSLGERARGWADLEERLGTNWLNKIGITVLVIGLGLLLNYWIPTLGKGGKIALAYTLSAGLLGLGIAGERREKYRNIGRVLIGGGWAATYATTYALHNVAEVRVVESAALGFLLLFGVAAVMVAHSLRYNSEVVTGLAYLLAFASVGVSQLRLGTMVASAVLAASLVAVLWRRGWYRLEPVAIVATYAVHWMWLRQIREWYGAHAPFPDFNASVALCTVYWATFTVSHFLRSDRDATQRNSLIAAFALNAAGYLAVLRYQSIHPEWRFWFLLGAGAVYLALAYVSRRGGRRLGFLLHSTLGAALLLGAIPYRYSGARLELLWLLQAEALLLVGWRAADAHLRKLGWAAGGILATYVTFHDISPRLAAWRQPDVADGWMLAALAAAYYLNARMTPRLLGESATETDTSAATLSTPVATAFLMAAAWLALPFMWTALAWAALGVVLAEVGRRTGDRVLEGCAHGAAALAAIRLLVVNLHYAPPAFGTNLRVLTLGLTAALFYFTARRIPALAGEAAAGESWLGTLARRERLPGAYTWSASTLAALLIWNEATNAAVALGWALAGLALVEAGGAKADRPLVAQGYTLLALSFTRIFLADLNADGPAGPFSARLLSVTVLAAVFYYAAWSAADDWRRMRAALWWFGSTALVSVVRFEAPLEWIAVAWAGMTVAFYWVGRAWGPDHLRYQSYVLTLFVALRCAFDNFYQRGPLWPRNVRTVTVGAASLLLYALLAAALAEKRRRPAAVPAEAAHD